MKFRELKPDDRSRVNEFYELTAYKRPVSIQDRVFVAEEDVIYGAVRIESREGVQVLRGMYMHPEHTRKGIGAMLLSSIEAELAMTDSYCIPAPHLLDFYGKAGFGSILEESAPSFLTARAAGYIQEGKEVVIMYRPAGPGR